MLLFTLPAVVQGQYTYTTNNGTLTITGYTGPGGAVIIPETISGLPVNSIGESAFSYHPSLTSVTIPNGVASIGRGTFYACHSLTSVEIPSSVANIADYAFSDCRALAGVTISSGVTRIGVGAFSECISLTSVTIPDSVANIGQWAFSGCPGLMEITVDLINSNYCSVAGVLFDKSQTTLVQYPARKAGSYTVPNSVINIGSSAFYECFNLTSVTFGNNVTSIGDFAFAWCSSLTNASIGNSVISLGDHAFFGCSLAHITIPASVISIGGYAFASTRLTSVTIPSNINSIGNNAFGYCTSLTGVYFNGGAPSLGSDVFWGAFNSTVYYLPGTLGWSPTYGGRPTTLWRLPYPLILTIGPSFGVQTNRFGFIISWATNNPVVVEACTNLANPVWSPLQTNTLTDGSHYFSDAQRTNYPGRFYRIRSQ